MFLLVVIPEWKSYQPKVTLSFFLISDTYVLFKFTYERNHISEVYVHNNALLQRQHSEYRPQ